MSQVMSHGAEAKLAGEYVEKQIEDIFKKLGYLVRSDSSDNGTIDWVSPKILLRQYHYTSIADYRARADFYVRNGLLNRVMRIECKGQNGSGSVDEKMLRFYIESIVCFPEVENTMIYSGSHFEYDSHWMRWLKKVSVAGWEHMRRPQKPIKIIRIDDARRFVRDWDRGAV